MNVRFTDPAINYYDFLPSLRAAWVMDPDGNPVEIVSRRSTPNDSPVGE